MATATDTPSKATGAKANGAPIKANGAKVPARARKASVKSATKAAAPKSEPKRAVRKPAVPKTTLEKVSARVTAAEKSVAHAASETAHAIKAAADHAIEAAHVPDTAKGIVAKVRAAPARLREAVTSAKKPAARKAATGKAATARKPASKAPASRSKVGTGTVLGVAAAGLAVGIAANLGRKAAVQAPSVMAGDWLEALKAEHKAALAILDKLAKSTPEQPAKRTLLLTQLKHALGKHAFTEENVIYPALREWGDKGRCRRAQPRAGIPEAISLRARQYGQGGARIRPEGRRLPRRPECPYPRGRGQDIPQDPRRSGRGEEQGADRGGEPRGLQAGVAVILPIEDGEDDHPKDGGGATDDSRWSVRIRRPAFPLHHSLRERSPSPRFAQGG